MEYVWIVGGFMIFGIAIIVVYALLKMASDTDRAVRHTEKMLNPLSDVFVTQSGPDSR